MSKQIPGKIAILLVALIILGAGILVGGRLTAQRAQAAPSPIGQTSYFSCTATEVGVFIQRVHVRCSNAINIGGNNIIYWAYPTSDSAGASRFLSLFETARATSQTVTIYYDGSDLSGGTFGCNTNDCRRIWGATSP